MSEIRVKDNESLDSALRRFKRSCARSGVLAEVRKREAYEKAFCQAQEEVRSCPQAQVQIRIADTRQVSAQAGLYGPLFLHPKRAGEKAARRLPCPPDMHVRTEHNLSLIHI